MFPIGANARSYIRALKQSKSQQSQTEGDAFTFAYGKTVWDTIKTNPAVKKAFDDNLAGRNRLLTVRWHEKFSAVSKINLRAKRSDDEILVVDVGGNQGNDLSSFREAQPGRLILQDLPETLERIDHPPDGIDVMLHDFFTPQPIRGASVYCLHSVLHDWSDDQARQILSRLAEAMDVSSRLLIDEIVLKSVGESVSSAEMDMLMLLLCNRGERSLYD